MLDLSVIDMAATPIATVCDRNDAQYKTSVADSSSQWIALTPLAAARWVPKLMALEI